MTQPRDKFIDVHGLAIQYLEWGEPNGAPLVLVHGFLDQAASWQPFVTSLQNKSNQPLWIVAPDCRGHGDSGWVGAGGYYHFPDYVFDLDCVIRALDVERFKDAVAQMGNLNESVRRAVVERAEEAFQDLDEQIDKQRGQ